MLKKIRLNIFFLIYRAVLKLRSPKLIAWMIYISLRKLKGIKKAKTSGKMLIIEKSFGIEDVRSSFKKIEPKYEILVAQKKIFDYIFNIYLNDEEITDGYYFSNVPRIIKKKAKLRNFYFEIIYELKKKINLDLVLAFNYAYRSLRELVPACKLNNIKFAVCQKESNFLNGELPEMLDGLRSHIDKFNGDLMTVYSERYKKLLVKTKVVKNRITKVVGMQRADKFFSSDFRPKQTYVLIFLIQTYRGLFKQNKKAIKFWEDLSEKAIKDILSVAKKNPKVNFIFKTRVPNEKFTRNQRIIINKHALNNCRLIYGGDSFDYIKNAKVIVGFNTVALLEGLAAKKKILVPYYEINNKFRKSFTMKITKPIIKAKNSKQFIRYLEKIINEKNYKLETNNQAKKLLRYHIGNSDGKSYLRFSKYLNSI